MSIENKYFCKKCQKKFSIEENRLFCSSCAKIIQVINNVPIFVRSDKYASNFSFQWNIHKKTQFDSSNSGISEETFFRRFGLGPDFFNGKYILEAGIGNGRYAEVPLKYGANLYGVDLSLSVRTAYENLKSNIGRLCISQADLLDLPFSEGSFDVIYAFGVLHHTPEPEQSFNKLVPLLKEGGVICITTYPEYGMYKNSGLIRKLTNKIYPLILYPLISLLVILLYYPYRYLGLRHTLLGKIFPIGLNETLSEAILVTYDCYSPKYQFCYAAHEVFSWFKKAGLVNIEVRPDPTTIIGYMPEKKIL